MKITTVFLFFLIFIMGTFLSGDDTDYWYKKGGKAKLPTITVIKPTSGTYYTGKALLVEWSSNGTSSSGFGIDLYNSNGSKYGYVYPGSLPSSTTSYSWIPAHSTTGTFFVRVYDKGNSSIYDDSPLFTLNNRPTITVIKPTSGTYYTGKALLVEWSSNGTSSSGFGIDLYNSNGSKYGYVYPGSLPSSTTSYSWIPAHSTTGTFFIRVYDKGNSSIYDDSPLFTLNNRPTITVIKPTSGTYYTGKALLVEWSSNGTSSSGFGIDLYNSNGSKYGYVYPGSLPSSTTSYSWIPAHSTTGTFFIRVYDKGNSSIYDDSPLFTLNNRPTITVIKPTSGTYYTGKALLVEWSSNGTSSSGFGIDLYNSNGSKYGYVYPGSLPSSTTSYSWIPAHSTTGTFFIRVYDKGNSSIYDDSPLFTLNNGPTITVIKPTSGTYYTGKALLVEWSSNGTSSSGFGIDLYNSNGSKYGYVYPGSLPSSTTSYSWIPAHSTTGTFFIRVYDKGNSSIYDDSPLFTLNKRLVETDPPFGSFETPKDGSTVAGSIAVTGWALDDSGIDHVKIYMESGKTLVYIGDAMLVEGARPDVEAAYPDYPNNTKAGWGYMMLTNFLPNGGNGTFVLHAIATDAIGKTTTLGSKTIIVDNANAVKPFGAIDTPAQGGTASGSDFVNWGWVLTPMPNSIPTDGSTINVWVDGVDLGHPTYNIYRSDIANKFPGYANSDGAIGYFYLDTTAYDNGVHTIQWTASDTGGNTDGIGSRYFTIQNTGADAVASMAMGHGQLAIGELSRIDVDNSQSVIIQKGFGRDIGETFISANDNGEYSIKIREFEPLKIKLNEGSSIVGCYQLFGKIIRKMPVGMTIKHNTLYWMPGVAYLGNYRFVIVVKDENGGLRKKFLGVTIEPKFGVEK